jgi:NAD(P)H dehydrogenase (quinone)
MKTIAIIGSAGTNARPWTEAFLKAGWRVRNLVRAPQKVVPRPNLTATAFDFDDAASHAAALAGIDVLALIVLGQPEQVAWETASIAAARRAGVAGIVKLWVIGADMTKPISLFARNAAQAETALRASGVPHVVLRANGFMQNLLRQQASILAGSYVEPSGATAASRIDVHDIADVAVAVAEGPFDGRALTLTGPAALTGNETAQTLTATLGRPVRFVSPPLSQFRAALAERGLPAWQIEAFVELQEAVLAGRAPHLAAVTGDVAAATGRPPRSFAAFCAREFGAPAASR